MGITQIGNALGYVRMVRSGGLYYTSQAIQYVPDLDDIVTFKPQVESAKLSAETIESAADLDNVLDRLSSSFAEGVDYFNMLVTAFQKVLATADHGHLRNFATIMPAICLNFVDHMLRKKDRLNRKSNKQDEAGFTDDGFALGCAFLLRVLDLYDDFDSLHWWEEVDGWLSVKDKTLQQRKQSAAQNDDDEEEWNLSYKRNMALSKEWKLLFFGFQASRIFFRVVEKNEGDEKEKEGKEEEDGDGDKKEREGNDDHGATTAANGSTHANGTTTTTPAPPTQGQAQNEQQHSYPTPAPQQQQNGNPDNDQWTGGMTQSNGMSHDRAPVPDDGLGF